MTDFYTLYKDPLSRTGRMGTPRTLAYDREQLALGEDDIEQGEMLAAKADRVYDAMVTDWIAENVERSGESDERHGRLGAVPSPDRARHLLIERSSGAASEEATPDASAWPVAPARRGSA